MMKNDIVRNISSLIKRNTSVLCAVSGGADSMCMLHMLHENRQLLGIKVYAAHFEHGIRGEESHRDCMFVEKYCREHGIDIAVEHGDVLNASKKMGLGTEETARILRYEFLEKTADRLNCDYIATAHNADDNAETLIFNLTRGAGSTGLKGIPKHRGRIIRPLLGMTRGEIEKYLIENGIPHVEDSTNASDDYTRNIIRHKVTPVLKQINPNFAHAAANTAELMRRDDEFLESLASEFIDRNYGEGNIALDRFNELHPSVAARVIRKLCPKTISMEQTDRVISLAAKGEKAYADLPGIRIAVERGNISFGYEQHSKLGQYKLQNGETVNIPEAGISVSMEISAFSSEINNSFKTYQLKYENIDGDIIITGKRDADKMRPVGRKCTKTLKSLFLEHKMTERERDLTPVIRDRKGIVAVVGISIDERCKAVPGDTVIKIIVKQHN